MNFLYKSGLAIAHVGNVKETVVAGEASSEVFNGTGSIDNVGLTIGLAKPLRVGEDAHNNSEVIVKAIDSATDVFEDAFVQQRSSFEASFLALG